MLAEFLERTLLRLQSQGSCLCIGNCMRHLRLAMLQGHLSAGERLPSSRDLAQDLCLSRNTVVAAVNQLSIEGYLVGRIGSGTYVSDQVPVSMYANSPIPQHPAPRCPSAGALCPTCIAPRNWVQPFTLDWQISALSSRTLATLAKQALAHDLSGHAGPQQLGRLRTVARAVADYLRVRSVQLNLTR